MRWRTTEKLPTEQGWYFLKGISGNGTLWFDGENFINGSDKAILHQGVLWLDESLPASAVEEAKKMYPYETEAKIGELEYLYSNNAITDIERAAHIRCAGMYTGEIAALKEDYDNLYKYKETLKAENESLKKADELQIQVIDELSEKNRTLIAENSKTRKALGWVEMEGNTLPLERYILVSHKYGVEAIHFHNHHWRYWYAGNVVDKEVINNITHFMIPEKPHSNE